MSAPVGRESRPVGAAGTTAPPVVDIYIVYVRAGAVKACQCDSLYGSLEELSALESLEELSALGSLEELRALYGSLKELRALEKA